MTSHILTYEYSLHGVASFLHMSNIIGIFYGREIFWYFIHANILKSYDSMCNYNIESKHVPEKKRLASN